MYSKYGIEEKYQRTSTPLLSTNIRRDANNSYVSCVAQLEEYPKRFRIYGTVSNLQGILCGNLIMETRIVDVNPEGHSTGCDEKKKKQKTTPEFYRVGRSERNRDCFNAFNACRCKLVRVL